MENMTKILIEAMNTEEMKTSYKKYRKSSYGNYVNMEEKISDKLQEDIKSNLASGEISTGNLILDKLLSEIISSIDTKEVADGLCEMYKPSGKNNSRTKLDSNRPLTEEEKEYASRPKNHDLIYKFAKRNKLDIEEWYDILAIAYLDAVKLYITDNKEECQKYYFSTILDNKLRCAVGNRLRAEKTQKRMPDGGFVSLDCTFDDDRLNGEGTRMEAWWIDNRINVEKQVILDIVYQEFREHIKNMAFGEDSIKIIDMLMYGYDNREVVRKMKEENGDFWNRDMLDYELSRLRKVFKEYFEI